MMKKAVLLSISLAFLAFSVSAQNINDAQNAIEAEQYAKAKGILVGLVKSQAKKGDNYFYLGQVYLKNDQLDSAKLVFEQGLAADPKNNLNRVGLGTVDLFNGNVSAAETKFKEAIAKLGRRNYLELYFIGRAYIDAPQPNYTKALEYLTQAKDRPRKPDPLVLLAMGDAYFGSDQFNLAYTHYRDAEYINPNLTRAPMQMAVIARGSHAWQDAIDDLLAITQAKPDYAPTYREIAETYYLWGMTATDTISYWQRQGEAVKYYKQYMDRTDYSVDSRIRYADFLVGAREYVELQKQAQELAQLTDVNPRILRYLGYAAYENGQYAESKDALDRLFARMESERIIPRDYLHLGLANLKIASEDATTNVSLFDEGIAQLEKAADLDTNKFTNVIRDYQQIGLEYFRKQQHLDALKIFNIGATRDGSANHVTDNYYFGISAMSYVNNQVVNQEEKDMGLLKRAFDAFGVVIAKSPETIDPYLNQARVQMLMDDATAPKGLAKPYFEKYMEVAKATGAEEHKKAVDEAARYYNGLAYSYIQAEAYDKAMDYFREALKIDPNNDYAKETLAYLTQHFNR